MFGKEIPRSLRNITGRAMKLYCLLSLLIHSFPALVEGEREGELLSPRSGTAYNIPPSLNTQPFARVYDISGEASIWSRDISLFLPLVRCLMSVATLIADGKLLPTILLKGFPLGSLFGFLGPSKNIRIRRESIMIRNCRYLSFAKENHRTYMFTFKNTFLLENCKNLKICWEICFVAKFTVNFERLKSSSLQRALNILYDSPLLFDRTLNIRVEILEY